jgi:hypothetical protein
MYPRLACLYQNALNIGNYGKTWTMVVEPVFNLGALTHSALAVALIPWRYAAVFKGAQV